MVAARINDVLKIRLNIQAVIKIERVKNFVYVLVGLHCETRIVMGGDVLFLGLLYVAGNMVKPECHTPGVVRALGPRAPVIGSSERLEVLEGGARIRPGSGRKKRQPGLGTIWI